MNEERTLTVVFWASPLLGLINIAIASVHAYRRSDALGWMNLALISLVIVLLFIGAAQCRKTLAAFREQAEEEALQRLTSAVSVFPVMAYVAIQAALSFPRN